MSDRHATTARTANALADIDTIRRELDWLERNLGTVDVVAYSKGHQPVETVPSRAHVDSGPVLSEIGQVQVRQSVRAACDALKAMRVDATACRVGLEKWFAGPGFDREKSGTMLEDGELAAARQAQERRQENEGDCRYGEWEAEASAEALSTIRAGAPGSPQQRLCSTCKTNWVKSTWKECATCRSYQARYKTARPAELAQETTRRKIESELDHG